MATEKRVSTWPLSKFCGSLIATSPFSKAPKTWLSRRWLKEAPYLKVCLPLAHVKPVPPVIVFWGPPARRLAKLHMVGRYPGNTIGLKSGVLARPPYCKHGILGSALPFGFSGSVRLNAMWLSLTRLDENVWVRLVV